VKIATKVAIEAAGKAGKLLSGLVKKRQDERIKRAAFPMDIVTESDIKSEKLIINTIRKYFPNHAILSEESSPNIDPDKQDHLWIIDPLDGTIAFAAGLPFYSVSIAYAFNKKIISSALFLASTNEVLWAETGKGAFIKKRKIKINDLSLEKSVIAFDPGNTWRQRAMTIIAPNLCQGIRFMQITPGEAGNLGLVARGNLQGLICVKPNVWDYAAGIHLVQEAGGVISDLKGKPYKLFSTLGHVVATPSVHKKIIKSTKTF
jgi:myo-inositol-1(or 4)-monophosphatase